MTELSAEPRPLKPQNLGPRAVLQRDGQGKARCSPVPWPIAERRRLTFNRGALQKNRFAGKERPGPLSLPTGSSAAFPVTRGSQKVKANIDFPLRRIKTSHPAQGHYFSNVRTDPPVFRKSSREKLILFLFSILKIKIPFQIITCFQEPKS